MCNAQEMNITIFRFLLISFDYNHVTPVATEVMFYRVTVHCFYILSLLFLIIVSSFEQLEHGSWRPAIT